MAYYVRKLKIPFPDALDKVIQNLEIQGFGVVMNIDLQETFRKSLQLPFRNYKIIGVYNPNFAYKAVSMESHAGVMLPCNVVVQEHENGEIEVSAINPLENLAGPFGATPLVDLAIETGIRLRAALDYLNKEIPPVHEVALPIGESWLGGTIRERAR